MKRYRTLVGVVLALLMTLPLFSCSVDDEERTGAKLWVEDVTPRVTEVDIIQGACGEGESATPEPFFATYAVVVDLSNTVRGTQVNEAKSDPWITLTRYKVEFTGLNMDNVNMPPIYGNDTVTIPSGGSASLTVIVMDFTTMKFIRRNYPTVGKGQELRVKAKFTISGEDEFKNPVETEGETTVIVNNYNGCA